MSSAKAPNNSSPRPSRPKSPTGSTATRTAATPPVVAKSSATAAYPSAPLVYYWVQSYARRHHADDLLPGDRPGRPTVWTEGARALLQELLNQSPTDHGYYAVSWTVPLLQEELRHGTGNHFSDDTIRRELHRLGYVWKRPRYQLEPAPELEKKTADLPASGRLAAL